MKRTVSTLVIASTTAALLAGSAAFAGMSTDNQLEQSDRVGLDSLQVPTASLTRLSEGQLAQLSDILGGTDSNADKQTEARHLIAVAVAPAPSLASPAGQAMLAALKADLASLGLSYPAIGSLTYAQVAQVLDAYGQSGVPSEMRQYTEAALADASRPATVTATNPGERQLEYELNADLRGVGLTPPQAALTFDQIGKLTDIFDGGGTRDELRDAAMKVMGIS